EYHWSIVGQNWRHTSFGTRGSQVQILPLRPSLISKFNVHRHRLRHRFALHAKRPRDERTMAPGHLKMTEPRTHWDQFVVEVCLQRRLGPVLRSGVATRKRPPTLTSDNQITPKPNLALNAEMKAVAERLTLRGTDPRRPQAPLYRRALSRS